MGRIKAILGIVFFGSFLFFISMLTVFAEQQVDSFAEIEVNNPADTGSGTLREALGMSQNNLTITFDPLVFSPSSPREEGA